MANDVLQEAAVDRLYDGLVTVGGFGRWQIFRDRNSLAAGVQWSRQLEDAVARAGAFLAVIGPGWTPTDPENDWVTRELRAALQSVTQGPVLPILLPDAEIPPPERLPRGLEHLPQTQALRISSPPSDGDVFALAAALTRPWRLPTPRASRLGSTFWTTPAALRRLTH